MNLSHITIFVVILAQAGCIGRSDKLARAALDGDMPAVVALIQGGANPNAADRFGHLPLGSASSQGYSNIVAYLIRQGADVNAVDEDGMTALLYAAGGKHVGCVKLLCESAACVEAKDKQGRGPVFHATSRGDHQSEATALEVLAYVTALSHDLNIEDAFGQTALDFAILQDSTNIVEFLSRLGGRRGSRYRQ